MCLLAVLFRALSDAPLVVAANREEHYDRGGDPPRLHSSSCRYIAGTDPRAGGTWLGVNEHGLVIAITNRRRSQLPAEPRSRGLLARELLECRSAALAQARATAELTARPYAGCNLLCADRERAVVFQSADWLRVRPLPPGLHVLTNHDINDASDIRAAHALNWLGGRSLDSAAEAAVALRELCTQTGDANGPAICLHGDKAGTVSSSILAITNEPRRSLYLHAQGSPDRVPYQDCSLLLRELLQ